MLKIYQRHLPTVGKKWYANWVFFWHSGQYTALWSTVVYLMRLEPCLNSKAFTTHIAYVRFLSSMSSHVVAQPSGACELLRTHLTLVWFVTAVSELMLHQVKWLDAGKIALITLERFFTWKKNKVSTQILWRWTPWEATENWTRPKREISSLRSSCLKGFLA